MKTTLIVFLFTFLSCSSNSDNNNLRSENLPVEKLKLLEKFSVEQLRHLENFYKEESDLKKYNAKLLQLLEMRNLDNLKLNENEVAFEFTKYFDYDKFTQIVQIIDVNSKDLLAFRMIKFSINEECYPIYGIKILDGQCLNVINKKSGHLTRKSMDHLKQRILENEFWELSETESEVRGYDGLLYHGESWSLKGAYGRSYRLKLDKDTTITKSHLVSRLIPQDSRSIYEIGQMIMDLTGFEDL